MVDSDVSLHPLETLAEEFLSPAIVEVNDRLSEYTIKHPDLSEKIRTLFPTMVMMEDLKKRPLHEAHIDHIAEGKIPERLGEFRILREVGRGGMGIVYEAEQESLGRRVAIKVLTAQALLDPVQLRRFRREAQMMVRLHHTNIVPVFGVGEHDGLLFYAMQLIRGRGLEVLLTEWRGGSRVHTVTTQIERTTEAKTSPEDEHALAETPLAETLPTKGRLPVEQRCREAARIGLQVADALHYAHAQGTFHRDIKPSNLLLDERCTAWVTDFGLAKLVEQDNFSRPGETAGTLRYMAPERFQGQSDGRSDIYSLGLTLYELVTLTPAFDDTEQGKLIRKVMECEPPSPRTLEPDLPRDLETVILKAIARDPAHRYATAQELANDLRRYLEDKPVHARRVSTTERLGRWCKRNPAIAGLLALAASLLVLVAVVTSLAYVQTRHALIVEAQLHEEADNQRKQAESNLKEANLQQAQAEKNLIEANTQKRRAEQNLVLAQQAVTREVAEHKRAVGQHKRAEENLSLALQAFEEMFTQATQRELTLPPEAAIVGEENEPVYFPLVSPEVAALLHNMLKFYDQFGERNQGDPRLHREIARAYRRVGDIEQRLGQLDKAETAYRRALSVCKEATSLAMTELVTKREVAMILNELGLLLQLTGRYADAKTVFTEALTTLGANPTTAPERFQLVRTHNLLGGLLSKTGQYFDGEKQHRAALKLLTDLLKDETANRDYLLAQARVHRSLSSSIWSRNGPQEAVTAQHKAVTILEKLANDYPSVPDYRYELSDLLVRSYVTPRGPGPRKTNEVVEKQLRRANELANALVTEFPMVPEYQSLRARSLHRLGSYHHFLTGNAEEAEVLYRDALTIQRSLVARQPKVPVYHYYLAETCQSLTPLMVQHGDFDEASDLLREAIEAQQTHARIMPENRFAPFMLARQYLSLAEVLRRQGQQTNLVEAEYLTEEANRLMERQERGHRPGGPPSFPPRPK